MSSATATTFVNVVELFRAQVNNNPNATALRCGKERLSYGELDRRSDAIAGSLRGRGVNRGDYVAIAMGRSFELYAAMLGVAKCGAAFVPLDGQQSSTAVGDLLRETGIRFVIAAEEKVRELRAIGLSVFSIDELAASDGLWDVAIAPDDPLYVMFTSGSTGKPKGVIVPHRAVVRLVTEQDFIHFGADEVFCQFAPPHFDASTLEIWGALLHGATLVVPPPQTLALGEIAEVIRENGVTTLWLTAAVFHLAVDRHIELFAPLRQAMFGGDVISSARVARLRALYPSLRMVNGYGPTENTTFTACYVVPNGYVDDGRSLPIGTPIRGTAGRILDEARNPVQRGEIGQLYAMGDGVALGYLNDAALTRERFVPDGAGALMYATGDLVREREDGVLEFCGRVDSQVKISGQRVELDAIEAVLRSISEVREAAVLAVPHGPDKQLIAFVELQEETTESELRDQAAPRLAQCAVPARFVRVHAMPLTATGKIDRQALRALASQAPTKQEVSAAMEQRIAQLWRKLLGRGDIDRNTPFFELGGTSLQVVEMEHELRSWGYAVSIAELFQHATIAKLAARLEAKAASHEVRNSATPNARAIAVIGIAGRFPGAKNPRELWANFVAGKEAITRFRDDELEDAYDGETRSSSLYIKARAIVDDVERFDAEFFGMHPREAELTDPQQRLLMECAWEALEDAGYAPRAFAGRIGVFAGASINTYLLMHLCADRQFIEEFASQYQVGAFPTLVGNGADFTASRIAYKLDLRGPAVTVQSACSTSLLAVAQACEGLRAGTMDMALAGAASVSLPQRRGYVAQEGGMVSPDGHCRPFDAEANGTVFGSGAGMVLLKRLEDALRDGDHIYAVIRGIGVNNDGAGKAGYAAPSVDGQADAIMMAHRDGGVPANSIEYVECHGTGTPLGDPIEVAALAKAFGDSGAKCAISSAKGSVGHLDVAAGVTGLMRACLALEHDLVPATLHYTSPNPRMGLEKTPFFVADRNLPWSRNGHPRRAGVSAFGVGGTNVHLVLEEAPARQRRGEPDRQEVLVLSARSPEALAAQRERLGEFFTQNGSVSVSDAAYTLAVGREHFAYRAAVVASDAHEAVAALSSRLTPAVARPNPRVAFLFPGQGSQYPGMAASLYATERAFREAVDECLHAGAAWIPRDLQRYLRDPDADAEVLRATDYAQPAIFIVEYALAKLWMSWGIQPALLVGHSVGEITAACLAGVFTLQDALKFVALRGRMMQRMRPGAMLSVRMGAEELRPVLKRFGLSLAAVNAAMLCVASGAVDAIAAAEAELVRRNVPSRRLHTSHAFHSETVDEILPELRQLAASLAFCAPEIAIISTCTGRELSADEARDPEYWARHGRETVQFAAAMQTLGARKPDVLLEVGPGQALEVLARQQVNGMLIAGSLPGAEFGAREAFVCQSLGKLWAAGCAVRWDAVFDGKRQRVPLPTYPFQRKRYWVEAPKRAVQSGQARIEEESTMKQVNAEREASLKNEVREVLQKLSGAVLSTEHDNASFLELGFDSLFLTQVTQEIQKRFGVKVTFRQLLGEYASVNALAAHIAAEMPAKVNVTPPAKEAPIVATRTAVAPNAIEALFHEQLQTMSSLMQKQLEVLKGAGTAAPGTVSVESVPSPVSVATSTAGSMLRVSKSAEVLTSQQKAHIERLIDRYTRKTANSKRFTQEHRAVLADPRVVAGFRPEWKEMVYSIVVDRSRGSKVWDIDGNKYVDLVNGFGPTMFGHTPEFVTRAIAGQMERGFEIGPQTPLAGEVAQLISELTGCERVTFCNTGSEAVMAALRVARTVTGRDTVVIFAGDYHGQFDEVLVKAALRGGKPGAIAAAPGIPASSVENVVVLDYGTREALQYLRANAAQLAAVLVEPVQSRHPGLQPREFLHEVRKITQDTGAALMFDEVVTGFRVHPGGAQALFGVQADLVTYGKVIGGGMPIGILAGRAQFMDALDGGAWQYGDASAPEVGMTFVAGTFVRHPLALAAAKAVLTRMKEEGPMLQDRLNASTQELVRRINREFERCGLTARAESFGSVFYFNLHGETAFASLLYYHLRERGVHILEGFPCYLTTEHTAADLDHVVRALAASLAEMAADGLLGTNATPEMPRRVERAPLTEAQLEVLMAAQLSDAANCAFNESFTVELEGELDAVALCEAVQALVDRHDALRATIVSGEMRFAEDIKLEIPVVDLRSGSEEERQQRWHKLLDEEASTPFALQDGPLVRVKLVKVGERQHRLIWTAHHIVCDGWSTNVLLGELGEVYSARVGGETLSLEPARSFGEFAQQVVAPKPGDTEKFWLTKFETIPALLDLPTDAARPAQRSYRGGTVGATLPAALNGAVREMSAKLGCTKFVALLAAFQIVLSRLAQQDETVVLVPSAAQANEPGALVGHGVNLLPIRARGNGEMTLRQYIGALNETVLEAYEHADYTYGTLVRKLQVKREAGRLPLSEVQFNLERMGDELQLRGLKASARANGKRFSNFDLFLNVVDAGGELRLECDYNADIFSEETVSRWLQYYATVVEGMQAHADDPVRTVPLLNASERQYVLHALNRTEAEYPGETTLPALIAEQAARTPERIAVRDGRERLTYAELERRAGQFASRLREMGVRPHDMVGVLVDRSVNMVAALLGVLKAGAAYVPLDPIYPKARIEFILNETQVPVLISSQQNVQAISVPEGTQVLSVERETAKLAVLPVAPADEIAPEALAYVIYTSGSTGQPKGVEISHRALVNLLWSARKSLGVTQADRMLAVTTISFDIAGLEMFLPLVCGAEVLVASKQEAADGARLAAMIEHEQVTIVQGTPSTWKLLLEAHFKPVRGMKALCGGEAWTRDLADCLLGAGCGVWNMYGPTETTIWSSIVEVKAGTRAPYIESSVANTRFYVLDENLQAVPFGVAGQLFIGGDGVARGYLKRPELTASRFVRDPFVGGARMYATGDRVRMLADGTIEFLGRADFQVKIRGYRIELGDVETAFSRTTGLMEVVAVAQEFGADDVRLVLYYAAPETLKSISEVRNAMRALVPDYMVPAMFVRMDRLPLTDNGKIDRKALRAQEREATEAPKQRKAAANARQATLCEICAQVLGVAQVGVDEDLLELGADSLHLFQITARAAQKGLPVSAKVLWSERTVERVCAAMPEGKTEEENAIRPRPREKYRVTVASE